jgi:hypothetical protein
MVKSIARTLEFEDSDLGRERFEFLFQGFVVGGGTSSKKGMEVVRREAKILDKFEEIGVVGEDGKAVFNNGGGTIRFTAPEFELIRSYFEGVPWNALVSRKVVAVADWLISSPQEDGSNGG